MPTRFTERAEQPATSSASSNSQSLRPMQYISHGGGGSPPSLTSSAPPRRSFCTGTSSRQCPPFPPRPDPHAAPTSSANISGGVPQYAISPAVGAIAQGRPYSHIMTAIKGPSSASSAPSASAKPNSSAVTRTRSSDVRRPFYAQSPSNGTIARHPGYHQHHQHHQQLQPQQQQLSPAGAGAEAPLPPGLRHYRHQHDRYEYVPSRHQEVLVAVAHRSARSAVLAPAASRSTATHRRLVSGDQASSFAASATALGPSARSTSHHYHHHQQYYPTGTAMSMHRPNLRGATTATAASPRQPSGTVRSARQHSHHEHNYLAAQASQQGDRRRATKEAAEYEAEYAVEYEAEADYEHRRERFSLVLPSAGAGRIVVVTQGTQQPGQVKMEDKVKTQASTSRKKDRMTKNKDEDASKSNKEEEEEEEKAVAIRQDYPVVEKVDDSSSRDEMYQNALLLASLANAPVAPPKKKSDNNVGDDENVTATEDDGNIKSEKQGSGYSTPETSPARPSNRELRRIDIGPVLTAGGQDRAALSPPSMNDNNGRTCSRCNETGAAEEEEQHSPRRRPAPNNHQASSAPYEVPRMAAAAARAPPRVIIAKPNIVTPVTSERPFVEDATTQKTVQHLDHRHRITETFPPPDSLFYERQQNELEEQRGLSRRRPPLPPYPPATGTGSGGYYISMRPSPEYYGSPRSSPRSDLSHSPEAVVSGGGTPPSAGGVVPSAHQLSPSAIFRSTTKRRREDDELTSGRDEETEETLSRRQSRPRHNGYVPPPPLPHHPLVARMPHYHGAAPPPPPPPPPVHCHDHPAYFDRHPHHPSARFGGDACRHGHFGAIPSQPSPPPSYGLHARPSPPPGAGYHLHAPPPPHFGRHYPVVQSYNDEYRRRSSNMTTVATQHSAPSQSPVEYDSIDAINRLPSEYIGKTVITKSQKWAWKEYPELEAFLIANRDDYLRHSAMRYTPQQKQFNNRLTERLIATAHRHNYAFHPDEYDFTSIRDRIRCYYKSYVQSKKKKGVIVSYPPLRSVGAVRQEKMDANVKGEENIENPASGSIACVTTASTTI